MSIKHAYEKTEYTRTAYVQSSLDRLRDLVAATADYAPDSDVIIEKKKITVIEHTTSNWKEKGVNE
jgi:hypothetical protein